jgi:hypothetical protein
MITHEHTDPASGTLHIVNLDNAAYVELDNNSAHIRVVFADGTDVSLNCASADTAKTEYIKLRRTMEGV